MKANICLSFACAVLLLLCCITQGLPAGKVFRIAPLLKNFGTQFGKELYQRGAKEGIKLIGKKDEAAKARGSRSSGFKPITIEEYMKNRPKYGKPSTLRSSLGSYGSKNHASQGLLTNPSKKGLPRAR
jgi:hypothetical protein